MNYRFLFELALIIFCTKVFGLVARKLGMPQVVGAIIAGILIGPSLLKIVYPSTELTVIAEIGVIFIMFTAGLETNLQQLKKCGGRALAVASAGVLLPLLCGYLLSSAFHGGFVNVPHDVVIRNVFIGVVLTATSVSITVETLRELGKLKTEAGTIILSAAIIDDVIGIAILSIIIGVNNPAVNPMLAIGKVLLFFVVAILGGVVIHMVFRRMSRKFPHHRRLPIMAVVVALLYAFCAERFFGVADITGAYIAGLIFAGMNDATNYVEKRIDTNSYLIFAPVFFAGIGIKASFSNISSDLLIFALCFVAVGIATKALGCYLMSRCFKTERRQSLIVGVGMIARGEVCLIVMQKGVDAGIVPSQYLSLAVLLVIVSSLSAPILLRLIYRKEAQKLPSEAQSKLSYDDIVTDTDAVLFSYGEDSSETASVADDGFSMEAYGIVSSQPQTGGETQSAATDAVAGKEE